MIQLGCSDRGASLAALIVMIFRGFTKVAALGAVAAPGTLIPRWHWCTKVATLGALMLQHSGR